ncbi:sugar phosphorylase, partial [Citrobacter cronae]
HQINVTYMDALTPGNSSDAERFSRFILAHAILLSFPGVPAIYIQSILGSRNDYEGVEKLGYNRAINRKKYHIRQIETELADETCLRHAIYHELSRLIVLRRNNKAFHPDSDFKINSVTPAVMQIKRTAETGEEITGLFNISAQTQTINIDIENGFDLISEESISGKELTLHAWQVMWIKK